MGLKSHSRLYEDRLNIHNGYLEGERLLALGMEAVEDGTITEVTSVADDDKVSALHHIQKHA